MSDNPLARFRRQGVSAPAEQSERPANAGERKPYRAFDPQDKVMSLDIHRFVAATYSPSYAYMINITYDNEYFTNFVIYFTFLRVEVRGKNLKEVITAIKLH